MRRRGIAVLGLVGVGLVGVGLAPATAGARALAAALTAAWAKGHAASQEHARARADASTPTTTPAPPPMWTPAQRLRALQPAVPGAGPGTAASSRGGRRRGGLAPLGCDCAGPGGGQAGAGLQMRAPRNGLND